MKLVTHTKRPATVIHLVVALTVLVVNGAVAVPSARAESIVFSNSYAVINPMVTCEARFGSTGSLIDRDIYPGTPTMSSPRYDQRTSYEPILWRWSGAQWQKILSYGQVFGSTAWEMPRNFGFNLPVSGDYYWRVSIVYRWYWNGVPERTEHVWAGTHALLFTRDGYQPVWGQTGSYCLMNTRFAN